MTSDSPPIPSRRASPVDGHQPPQADENRKRARYEVTTDNELTLPLRRSSPAPSTPSESPDTPIALRSPIMEALPMVASNLVEPAMGNRPRRMIFSFRNRGDRSIRSIETVDSVGSESGATIRPPTLPVPACSLSGEPPSTSLLEYLITSTSGLTSGNPLDGPALPVASTHGENEDDLIDQPQISHSMSSPSIELSISNHGLDNRMITPRPFLSSPFENGLLFRATLPTRFESWHPLDHPLLRFTPHRGEKKRAYISRLLAFRGSYALQTQNNAVIGCPLCSDSWMLPTYTFSELVQHYQDVHWNRRRRLRCGRTDEEFTLFPCYRYHGSDVTRRLLFEALKRYEQTLQQSHGSSSSPAIHGTNDSDAISLLRQSIRVDDGLSDEAAVLYSKLSPASIRSQFIDGSSSSGLSDKAIAFMSHLNSELHTDFGLFPQQAPSEGAAADRDFVISSMLSIRSKTGEKRAMAELKKCTTGLLFDVLPHWHCPHTKHPLHRKRLKDLWGQECMPVSEWNIFIENLSRESIVDNHSVEGSPCCRGSSSQCSYVTSDWMLLIKHLAAHPLSTKSHLTSDQDAEECTKEAEQIVHLTADRSMDDPLASDHLATWPSIRSSGDKMSGHLKRRVSFDETVAVRETNVMHSRMEQYGCLHDEGIWNWDQIPDECDTISDDRAKGEEKRTLPNCDDATMDRCPCWSEYKKLIELQGPLGVQYFRAKPMTKEEFYRDDGESREVISGHREM